MGRPDERGEPPEQLRKRAGELRACARRARSLAKTLGPHLDPAAKKAQQSDPPVWRGPFATDATRQLVQRRNTLHQMASALMHDAGRWEAEANRLDEQATDAAAKKPTGAGN
ncbi:hypothetical protein OYE22_30025 [Streptomyces sp. 71268]|uniref:hypothetical protein n=1 Tax=Streptomyces sp. 71268 TaxID=3002640 RepID=UPI0023FA2AD1|nr:hypothetical protein [Streptomyces sp. 71268]WEV28952.1 hypothetical protein OYE22_30025 [Streptomyces sp. 71268]